MIVVRTVRTSMLLVCRMSSPRRSRGRVFRDSAPGSRRSSAVGVSRPLRRTRRTSKPPRGPLLRIFRKVPRRAFFHKASSPPRGANPCNFRRRWRPRRVLVRRKSCRARLRDDRPGASSPSHAPCGGGSLESVLRIEPPLPGLWRTGRVRRPGFSRGRIRSGFARARDNPGRILDINSARGVRPLSACGVCDHKRVASPGPYGAWFPSFRRLESARTAVGRRDVLRAEMLPRRDFIPCSSSGPRRGVRPRAAVRSRGP